MTILKKKTTKLGIGALFVVALTAISIIYFGGRGETAVNATMPRQAI